MNKCCKKDYYDNLEFDSVGSCFGYNNYRCVECNKLYSVPVEPNFDEI